MRIIHLELEDELVKKLSPHQNKLPELLELGLQVWQERERQKQSMLRSDLVRTLEQSGKIQAPRPYTQEDLYLCHSPVEIDGKGVSEIVIEQRGAC